MRHFKADVSHRRRRRPSIFSAAWFRLLIGGGGVVILALVLGPPITAWFRSDASPRNPVLPRAGVLPGAPAASAREPATREEAAPVAVPESPTPGASAGNGAGKPAPAAEAEPAPAPASTPKAAARTAGNGSSALFRVQIGAFLDHRNADRLVQRLRAEKLEVVDTVLEQSRVLYRVVAVPAESEGYAGLVERLQRLGLSAELTDEGAAVTGLVPLGSAVETARRLREQGVVARLEREAGAAAFRVVRVGGYATAAEAERARTELAARGLEGFVVRER